MKWTSIEKSPPEKEGFYLIQSKYRRIPYAAWYDSDQFWIDFSCADYPTPLDTEYIIAWMPLSDVKMLGRAQAIIMFLLLLEKDKRIRKENSPCQL